MVPVEGEHTPGKLTFRHSSDGKRYCISGSANNYFVNLDCSVDSDDKYQDVALANTKRLVACWNALVGIPTEVIETGIVGFTTDLGPARGVCSWCGMELYGDSDPQARMRQHQRECVKHPMAALLAACKEGLRICRMIDPSAAAHELDRAEQMFALAVEKAEEKA